MPQRNGKRAGDREAIETRRRKVWEYRLAGMSAREIARKLTQEGIDVTHATVAKDVNATLAELAKHRLTDAAAARDMELARLDKVAVPIAAKAYKGDPQAAQVLLRISERRAKLLGLDAPMQLVVKHELAERLQKHGLSASDALEMFLGALEEEKTNVR